MRKEVKNMLIIILFIISGIFYYYFATKPKGYIVLVQEVIDGDTIKTELGDVRLLGVNTPEKNMSYYEDSRDFLKTLVFNKSVRLEIIFGNERDKYNRILAYVFYGDVFVNREILERGYGNSYYYEQDRYVKELLESEAKAKSNEAGIWKKSVNYGCLNLKEFKTSSDEKLVIENFCTELDVIIKDSANHIYYEKLNKGLFEKNFSSIWNNEGDSLFIWDKDGLILFFRYS